MRRFLGTVLLGAVTLAGTGCERDRTERMAESYSTASKPTYREPPRPPPQIAPTGLAAISVEEDYEERAAITITAANLEAQLSELEKELTQ